MNPGKHTYVVVILVTFIFCIATVSAVGVQNFDVGDPDAFIKDLGLGVADNTTSLDIGLGSVKIADIGVADFGLGSVKIADIGVDDFGLGSTNIADIEISDFSRGTTTCFGVDDFGLGSVKIADIGVDDFGLGSVKIPIAFFG